MDVADYARMAVDTASDRLGSDVALLDLRSTSDFTDFFVIASGETDRHLEALANDVESKLRDSGLHLSRREGTGKGGWIVLDFPGFMVHLFSKSARSRYGIEKLWARATEVVRIQ